MSIVGYLHLAPVDALIDAHASVLWEDCKGVSKPRSRIMHLLYAIWFYFLSSGASRVETQFTISDMSTPSAGMRGRTIGLSALSVFVDCLAQPPSSHYI